MRTGFFGMLLLLAVLNGCVEMPSKNEPVQLVRAVQGDPDSSKVIDYYYGTLPCADCEGIEQQLWLLKKRVNDGYGMFLLRETYLQEDTATEQILNSRGTWKIEQVRYGEEEINVLRLVSDESISALVKTYELNENRLTLLDQKGRRIKSQHNYSLNREN